MKYEEILLGLNIFVKYDSIVTGDEGIYLRVWNGLEPVIVHEKKNNRYKVYLFFDVIETYLPLGTEGFKNKYSVAVKESNYSYIYNEEELKDIMCDILDNYRYTLLKLEKMQIKKDFE